MGSSASGACDDGRSKSVAPTPQTAGCQWTTGGDDIKLELCLRSVTGRLEKSRDDEGGTVVVRGGAWRDDEGRMRTGSQAKPEPMMHHRPGDRGTLPLTSRITPSIMYMHVPVPIYGLDVEARLRTPQAGESAISTDGWPVAALAQWIWCLFTRLLYN